MKRFNRTVENAWYSGARWLIVLYPLEWLFLAVASLRRGCYRAGILPRFRPDVPLVIVGNISLGGTGKTPVVIALVEALAKEGVRAGVVARGYGARAGSFPRVVDKYSTPLECGDEAVLIHSRTGCPCVVAPSRAAAVRCLLEKFTVDLIISDDGLQHYALARDMEIVMYDTHSGFGNGHCLPAGPLREPLTRLASVDFVLGRGDDDPLSGVSYRPDGLINIVSGEYRELSPLAVGPLINAVAGLGRPQMFFESLRGLGFIVREQIFPDHHRYSVEDFSEFGDAPIIMTEKDAVKCRELLGDNAWYLRVSASLPVALVAAVASLVEQYDTPDQFSRSSR